MKDRARVWSGLCGRWQKIPKSVDNFEIELDRAWNMLKFGLGYLFPFQLNHWPTYLLFSENYFKLNTVACSITNFNFTHHYL